MHIGKLTLALFILFLSLIQGSLAQTTPNSESQVLIGTRWIITDENGDKETVELQKDDVLKVEGWRPSRVKSTWDLNGTTIEFYFNNGYAIYTGSLQGSENMKGTAKNVHKETWTWTAKKYLPLKESAKHSNN